MKEYRDPVFLKPYFQQNIWGGRRLETEFGFSIPDGSIGECWAVSAYPGCESIIANGPDAGMKLSEFWSREPEFFGDLPAEYRAAGYPFITKIIDAKENLSIQVHPDDAYAAAHENGARGKTECWYILDCPEHAELVLGHNARTREELRQMIEEHRWDELLRRVPVRRGDFIQLEPGTIHAITAGVCLLETQQSSDITYRVYDYDRLQNGKPRELHKEQSIAVTTIPAGDPDKMVLHTDKAPAGQLFEMVKCKYYRAGRLPVSGRAAVGRDRFFRIVTVTDGNGTMKTAGSTAPLKKGDSFLLPADSEGAEFEGTMNLIVASPVL